MLISVVRNGKYSYNKLLESSFKIFKVPPNKNIELYNPNIKKSNICIVYTCDISKKLNYLLYTDIIQQMFTSGINSILMSYLRQKLNLIYYINLSYFKVQNLFLSIFEFSTDYDTDEVIESFFHCINSYRKIKNIKEIIKGAKEKIILDYNENNTKYKTSFIENFYSSQILNGCSNPKKIIYKKDIIKLINQITNEEIYEIINYLFNKNSIVVCKQLKK